VAATMVESVTIEQRNQSIAGGCNVVKSLLNNRSSDCMRLITVARETTVMTYVLVSLKPTIPRTKRVTAREIHQLIARTFINMTPTTCYHR